MEFLLCNDVINENKQRMEQCKKKICLRTVCENDVLIWLLVFLLEGYCRINFMPNRANKIEPERNGMEGETIYPIDIYDTNNTFGLVFSGRADFAASNLRDFHLMGTYSHTKGDDLLFMLFVYL